MAKEANFKAVAKQIVKQVAGSERLNCFVVHVDNDVVVATDHYMLVIPKEVFKRDFKTEPKLGRYENFFFELGNFDYYIRNNQLWNSRSYSGRKSSARQYFKRVQ